MTILHACSDQTDSTSVDTTIAEAELSIQISNQAEREDYRADSAARVQPAAVLVGELSYPSEEIPEDMRVCAENVASSSLHCDARFEGGAEDRSYQLAVPPGRYRVYAQTASMPGYKAYYTEGVTCGLSVECTSREPIVVEVAAGETKRGVDPQDWYRR